MNFKRNFLTVMAASVVAGFFGFWPLILVMFVGMFLFCALEQA